MKQATLKKFRALINLTERNSKDKSSSPAAISVAKYYAALKKLAEK